MQLLDVADAADLVELCHERGWTDGLPVVPPTPDRVEAALAASGWAADEVVCEYLERRRVVTAEQVAVNAVLAGCRPEHVPVVMAIVEAMGDPAFELHIANASTGGSAIGRASAPDMEEATRSFMDREMRSGEPEVEGAGGRINAYTSFDVTVYHATLPSEQLPIGLDVLSDAVLYPRFEPVEIEREIEVVLEEIRRSEDSPSQVLCDLVLAETFRRHPYRAPILGTPESVAAIDRKRLRAFFERWYAPANLTVVAAGAFQREALRAAVEAAFPAAGGPAPRRGRPAEPGQEELRSVVVARPFERADFDLTWASVGLADPDAAALDLLAFVLGGCESSRLVRRVKEREGLVDRIDASCYTPLDPGFFSIGYEAEPEQAGASLEATLREVERVRIGAISAAELETARANFLAMEHFERESVSGQAQKRGCFELLAGDFRVEERYLEAVKGATAEDLRRVAHQRLAPERLTVGVLLPEEAPDAIDAGRIRDAVRRGVEGTARSFAVPRVRAREPERVSFELPGGSRLHVLPRREIPVVAARAAVLGGLLAESWDRSGLSSFLCSMWCRGTRSRSAADFARSAEALAAEIDGFTGRSSSGLTLETPSENLGPALDLFTEVLLEPGFDREEIERERRDTLAAIERREDRLAARAFLLFAETHFQHHPYRQPLLGRRESVESFDRDSIEAHHRRLVRGPGLVLALSGDLDPDAVAEQLSSQLAELPAQAPDWELPAEEPPPSEIRRVELQKDRAQAHLVIGFRGLTVRDDDRFALEIVSQLLAGQGGRLFLELRDRRGLAYAVNAVNGAGRAPGSSAAYIATAGDKLEEARKGLLEELDALVQRPPASQELERARQHLVGGHVIDQQRNAYHAAQVSLNDLYGLGPAADRSYVEKLRAVSAEDVLRVARRVVRLDAYTQALVHP